MTPNSLRAGRAVRLVAVLAALSLLAACAPGGGAAEVVGPDAETAAPDDAAADGDDDAEAAVADVDSLEFVWPGTSEPEMAVAEEFGAAMADDGLTIDYSFLSWGDMQSQLAVRIQGGNPPDLTMTQEVADLVRLGGLAPLDEYLEASDLSRDDFRPGTLEYSTLDGELYAIPYLAQAFTLVVNTDLLEAAGWSLEDLQTWEDVEEAAAAMTDGDTYGFAYPMGNPRFAYRVPLTAAYSNDLRMNDVSPEAEQRWKELFDHFLAMEPYRPPADVTWDYPDMFRAYANSEVGMIAAGTFFTGNMYELNPDLIGASRQIAYPAGPSADEASAPVSNVGYGVFADGQAPERAWEVLEDLVTDEWTARQAAVVHAPARSGIDIEQIRPHVEDVYPEAVDGHLQQIEDATTLIDEVGVPQDPILGQAQMEPEVQEVMRELLDGSMDRDEAYEVLMERLTPIVEAQGDGGS